MGFKKIMSEEWTTLETIASRMKKQYPYYFLMAHKEEMGLPRHAWYEVCNEEHEKLLLKYMNKQLKYKGSRSKPT